MVKKKKTLYLFTLCIKTASKITSPKECPFFCTYDSSACCPFTGEPVCEPVCNTFAPCKVTPCPENCPGHCHYPDANSCCPRSGKAVCNIGSKPFEKRNVGGGYKSGGYPNEEVWGIGYSMEAKGWAQNEEHPWAHSQYGDHQDYDYGYGQDYGYSHNYGYGPDYGQEYDYHHGHGHEHNQDCDHDHDHNYGGHHQGDDDYYEGLFIGGLNKGGDHECHSCVKTITDIDISLEFVTTTVQPEPIFCAQYIIPW